MKLRKFQSNFTAGEVSDDLLGRIDLALTQNGAARIRDCKIVASGGVRRRAGMELCAEVVTPAPRYLHIEYIFDEDETYQLLFSDTLVNIYHGVTGALLQSITGLPWTGLHLTELSVHAVNDLVFVCHHDLGIFQLRRTGLSSFAFSVFAFEKDNSGISGQVFQPYHRFVRPDVRMGVDTLPGSTYTDAEGWKPGSTCIMVCDQPIFVANHVGTFFQVGDGQIEVTAYVDPTTVHGVVQSPHLRLSVIENALTINAGTTQVTVYDPFHSYLVGDEVMVMNANTFGAVTNYDALNGLRIVIAVDISGWAYSWAPVGPVTTTAVVGGGPDIKLHASRFHTVDWKEQMYSRVRGWPHCVSSYQQRLIFAGGDRTPNRLNMSRIDSPFNFDVGTGAADDSIQIGISGKRTPIIRQVLGAQHLQLFTSEGEYFVPRLTDSAGLSPTTISVLPQSVYGVKRGLRVHEFDGASLFISKNGNVLRQLVFNGDLGYDAPSLSFPAQHLIRDPLSLSVQVEDTRNGEATAYIVNGDFSMAVFVMVRSEKVAAWGLWGSNLPETNAWLTACAVDNRVFFVVNRTIAGLQRQFLWKGNRDRLLDGSIMGAYFGQDGQEYLWRGFGVYAGLEISLVVDGRSDIGLYRVEKHDPVTAPGEVTGQVRIMSRAQTLEGGFGFNPLVRTLPPEMQLQDGPSVGEMRRVVRAGIKVKDSLGMKVDRAGRTTGRTKILNTDAHTDLGVAAQLINGNVEAYLLGWDDTGQVDIVQTSNAPMTVLSINAEVEF